MKTKQSFLLYNTQFSDILKIVNQFEEEVILWKTSTASETFCKVLCELHEMVWTIYVEVKECIVYFPSSISITTNKYILYNGNKCVIFAPKKYMLALYKIN